LGDRFEAVLAPAMMFGCALLAIYSAIFRPAYLTNSLYLAGLIFLQILAAALWDYHQRFLPLLVVAFLWAGTALPWQGVWTTGRWVVLAVGALTGLALYMRDPRHSFSAFHLLAFFSVLAAFVSAMVSSYGSIALLKAASLFLLFLYGATGARIAALGRQERFIAGLLLGCEMLIYLSAASYFVLHRELFDNPNSLGAVMGVVAVPVMLWGTMVTERVGLRQRRTLALVLALVLVIASYARAGIAAAAFSSIFLCVGLRRYRILARGVVVALLAASLIITIRPFHMSDADAGTDAHSLADVFLYKQQRGRGLLWSRKSAWDQTSDVIRDHPWFGSGFGTSVTRIRGAEAEKGLAFESAGFATREHGNSYLAIMEWVGLLGVGPFFAIVFLLTAKVYRVGKWMRSTGNAFSTAVPLAAVVAGGLLHALFEDWLFAVGYYLCVFFWTLVFILVDVVPPEAPALVRSPVEHNSAPWVPGPALAQR